LNYIRCNSQGGAPRRQRSLRPRATRKLRRGQLHVRIPSHGGWLLVHKLLRWLLRIGQRRLLQGLALVVRSFRGGAVWLGKQSLVMTAAKLSERRKYLTETNGPPQGKTFIKKLFAVILLNFIKTMNKPFI
jgi:hypothetical protein